MILCLVHLEPFIHKTGQLCSSLDYFIIICSWVPYTERQHSLSILKKKCNISNLPKSYAKFSFSSCNIDIKHKHNLYVLIRSLPRQLVMEAMIIHQNRVLYNRHQRYHLVLFGPLLIWLVCQEAVSLLTHIRCNRSSIKTGN